ncbi:iron-sulfur cluster assembly protein, partial [Alphaproteobacteria bacterium]|nr:iron-sulfur cluster assembly protein [Alphaproteobacteria bacterium]
MANELTEEKIRKALSSVTAPGKSGDIVAAGQVSGIVIKDGHVGFTIQIDSPDKSAADKIAKDLRTASEKAVRSI